MPTVALGLVGGQNARADSRPGRWTGYPNASRAFPLVLWTQHVHTGSVSRHEVSPAPGPAPSRTPFPFSPTRLVGTSRCRHVDPRPVGPGASDSPARLVAWPAQSRRSVATRRLGSPRRGWRTVSVWMSGEPSRRQRAPRKTSRRFGRIVRGARTSVRPGLTLIRTGYVRDEERSPRRAVTGTTPRRVDRAVPGKSSPPICRARPGTTRRNASCRT